MLSSVCCLVTGAGRREDATLDSGTAYSRKCVSYAHRCHAEPTSAARASSPADERERARLCHYTLRLWPTGQRLHSVTRQKVRPPATLLLKRVTAPVVYDATHSVPSDAKASPLGLLIDLPRRDL